MFTKVKILASAATLTLAAFALSACTAADTQSTPSSSSSSAATNQTFTMKNATGDKVDVSGLKLQGSEASQKLADVLAYSSKVALAQGYAEKGHNETNTEQIIYVYDPSVKKLAGYNVTTNEKTAFDDNSMTTVFGLEYYLKNNPKTKITLQEGHFTLVNGANFKATIDVNDGLIVKSFQEYGEQGSWTSDISYTLTPEDINMVSEAINSANHAHDANGNDIPAG